MTYEFNVMTNLERVLIVDDTSANLDAAKKVFPQSYFAQNAQDAIRVMETTDIGLVITDLNMETKLAGHGVVAQAYLHNIIPYVLTHAGNGHTGEIVSFLPKPDDAPISFSGGKTNLECWNYVFEQLQNPNDWQKSYHRVFLAAKSLNLKLQPLDLPTLQLLYTPMNYLIEYVSQDTDTNT
jgi:CheY-like chemotaxis protein